MQVVSVKSSLAMSRQRHGVDAWLSRTVHLSLETSNCLRKKCFMMSRGWGTHARQMYFWKADICIMVASQASRLVGGVATKHVRDLANTRDMDWPPNSNFRTQRFMNLRSIEFGFNQCTASTEVHSPTLAGEGERRTNPVTCGEVWL